MLLAQTNAGYRRKINCNGIQGNTIFLSSPPEIHVHKFYRVAAGKIAQIKEPNKQFCRVTVESVGSDNLCCNWFSSSFGSLDSWRYSAKQIDWFQSLCK